MFYTECLVGVIKGFGFSKGQVVRIPSILGGRLGDIVGFTPNCVVVALGGHDFEFAGPMTLPFDPTALKAA